MKITRVETIPVEVPLKEGLTTKTAGGEHVVSPYVVVRVHTDAGLVGLGEATLSPRWSGETSPGCVAAIEGLIGPAITGQDPIAITALRRTIDGTIRHNPFAKAAVEMALWDIAGKAAGQPVYQLLGGKVKDELPMKMVVGAFPVDQAVALAQRFLDWGATCLKVKVGLDPTTDIARVHAVREAAGPDIPIGIDANQGWDLATARRCLADMGDLLFAEQPVPTTDPRDLARLRGDTRIPIMADESVFTLQDARRLTELGACDILSVYPGKHAGIAATREIAHVARAAGVVCSMGSNLELGIATAAMLHLAAAEPSLDDARYPGDYLGPLYHQADLLKEPLQLGPSVARVPDGPGLGVELDEDQLERYRDTSGRATQLG
ncbi:MAG: mandelate racemase/muconate lactonizing protein [Gemmatimonadetes bacterium]|jgi:L-alanine-DL-glutamate epimerase-like enolase superfamily enzyme|nr:mandelate racemase/muconate lactonizing protein [Gemmatimonadota bacterium]